MTLADGEKAVERARDTSANGAGGQGMRRVALACGVRGLVDSRILPGTGPDGAIIISRAEPSRAEPSRAEPSRAEPSRAEPSRAEPSRAEPSRAEPSRAEPSRAEPSRAEPSRAEPSRAEPSRAEPSRAEPSRAEPSRAEPSRAEPSRAEPSRAEPSRAEPSRAEPSRAEPSRAEPSRAEPSRAEPSRAEPSLCPPGRVMPRLSGSRSGRPPSSLPSAPLGAQSDPLPTDPPGAAPSSRLRDPASADRHTQRGRAGRFLSACARRAAAALLPGRGALRDAAPTGARAFPATAGRDAARPARPGARCPVFAGVLASVLVGFAALLAAPQAAHAVDKEIWSATLTAAASSTLATETEFGYERAEFGTLSSEGPLLGLQAAVGARYVYSLTNNHGILEQGNSNFRWTLRVPAIRIPSKLLTSLSG